MKPRVGKKIDLSKTGTSNKIRSTGDESCDHPDINGRKTYLVRYGRAWLIGQFSRQWYGWNFGWFWSATPGLQLDALDEVYEMERR